MQPRRGQDLVISLRACEAILTTSCVSETENLVLWKVGFLKLQWSQDSPPDLSDYRAGASSYGGIMPISSSPAAGSQLKIFSS